MAISECPVAKFNAANLDYLGQTQYSLPRAHKSLGMYCVCERSEAQQCQLEGENKQTSDTVSSMEI